MNTPFPTQTRADTCPSPLTLYRACIALPDSMACQPRQERIVFFEVPTQQAGTFKVFSALESLLATAWSVSTEDWVERGLIYNTWSEQDLFTFSAGEGDSRLFETAWGAPTGIYYADAADVDLFVSPRTRARLDKALQAIAASSAPAALPDQGTITLPAPAAYMHHYYRDSSDWRSLVSHNNNGEIRRLQTPHKTTDYETAGIWYGSETRIDATGRSWGACLPHKYVQDDFGFLVPIKEAS